MSPRTASLLLVLCYQKRLEICYSIWDVVHTEGERRNHQITELQPCLIVNKLVMCGCLRPLGDGVAINQTTPRLPSKCDSSVPALKHYQR